MYIFAYLLLVTAFLCSVGIAGAVAVGLWQGQARYPRCLKLAEKGAALSIGLMAFVSVQLFCAFVAYDFSLEYVARYSDRLLPLFYRLTAFWAGQEGSLLFWALSTGIFGLIFLFSRTYADLLPETKLWYWLFFMSIQAFFLLLLTNWSNPFIILSPAVQDGLGLNPLLQHPGMIFHPPLLFLGYAGFTVPACLALAQAQSAQAGGKEAPWFVLARPYTLWSWILLSAGIILGAWWAYEELGWGGYWAWDPVENASLIPWLVATAMLHTLVVEARSGQMARLNISLIGLTLICAYIATYIVRTGVVQSLHAFPDEGVGVPLFIFICLCLAVTALGTASAAPGKEPCDETPGRYLPLVLVCMFLLALALIILLATLWPVISTFISGALEGGGPAKGFSAEAYNRACTPLFALLVLFLVFCPWLVQSWRNNVKILVVLGLIVLGGLAVFQQLVSPYIEWEGPRSLTSPLASASAVAFMVSFGILLWKERLLRRPVALAAHLVHLGVILMALGVAFSGPCKVEITQTVRIGETVEIEGFRFTLNELYAGQTPAYRFFEAEISIGKGDTDLGILSPQRRTYLKRPDQNFLEAATRFSLGTELYAALLGVDGAAGTGDLRLSLHPLVNWIWIGGTLLCIAPIISLVRIRNRKRTEN